MLDYELENIKSVKLSYDELPEDIQKVADEIEKIQPQLIFLQNSTIVVIMEYMMKIQNLSREYLPNHILETIYLEATMFVSDETVNKTFRVTDRYKELLTKLSEYLDNNDKK